MCHFPSGSSFLAVATLPVHIVSDISMRANSLKREKKDCVSPNGRNLLASCLMKRLIAFRGARVLARLNTLNKRTSAFLGQLVVFSKDPP